MSRAWRRFKKDDDQSPGAPLWMVTYSDMVTLLLAFFVLMFSFSSVDARKFEQVILSMRGALGVLESGQTVLPDGQVPAPGQTEPDGNDLHDMLRPDLEQMAAVQSRLRETIDQLGVGDVVAVTFEERGLVVRFEEGVLFDSGRADLRPDGLPVLAGLAPTLRDIPNHIRIEGHTDTVPIHTAQFPSNWELSTARATQVTRYFLDVEGGFEPRHMSAAGYGEYRPIADNDTAAGRQKNRRVDIVILYVSETLLEP